MAEFIPFARPDVGEDEAQAAADAVRSGWLTSGPNMRAFEDEFAAYLGGGVEAVAVTSATAGLHLALEAIGVGPGDEVIVPTWTFTATAEVVRYQGATPIIVDVEPGSLNLSAEAVARAITSRTRAVIPVHFAGLFADLPALRAVIGARPIAIVEDAAHALPTIGADGLVGACAGTDAAVFSFYATKTMTTGEGGMLTTRDQKIAARARIMRLHGIDRDAFDRYHAKTPAWKYDVVAPGFKYNMTDIAASIGRVQLGRVEAMHERRQAIAEYYLRELDGLPLDLPPGPPAGQTHAWHLFVIGLAVTATLTRDDVIARLAQAGVGTSVHFIPLHQHSYWRSLVDDRASFPVADAAFARVLSLPNHSGLTDGEAERVVAAARGVFA